METRRKYYRRRKRGRGGRLFLKGLVLCAVFFLAVRGFSEGPAAETPSLSADVKEREISVSHETFLPERFDLRERVKISEVPDQGSFGTCWAFASLLALETSMEPSMRTALSADHMSIKNSFGLGQNDGGEYSMSMAYLLAWQGPVREEEDPYGDGYSPDGLSPVCHVQEIRILPEKDLERIKRAVYETGGVQSSLYVPMEDQAEREKYYREDTFALYYDGEREPNHDVVILGWDDGFPKENFKREPEEDGAFLCMNSWGSGFGDGGCFWVSYEDSRLGIQNVLYSGIEPADNYDVIHQTDLCGWTGQLGYGGPDAWFGNVCEAETEETIQAAGFYATKAGTSCRIYAARRLPEAEDGAISMALRDRELVAEGSFSEAGFYTVPFEQPVLVNPGERFAVLVEIHTPGTDQPVAIEYQAGSRTGNVDIADGEGYISADGRLWKRAEEEEACSLCLKVYGNIP